MIVTTRLFLATVVSTLCVAGCTTTEDANKAIKGRWIGQSSDAFFGQYGAPVSQFALNNGGTMYTWQGGGTTREMPATYRDMTDTEKEAAKNGPRTIININNGGSVQAAPPGKVLLSPAKSQRLSCEAQITTNPSGVITDIKATRDTDGEGLSLSRCAEVFGVGE